jgi:hypothetical protein
MAGTRARGYSGTKALRRDIRSLKSAAVDQAADEAFSVNVPLHTGLATGRNSGKMIGELRYGFKGKGKTCSGITLQFAWAWR